MSDLNLLPCPFCGGAPSILSSDMAAWACCTGCEAEGPALDTKKEAALAWNRRAAPIAAQLDAELPPLPERDGDWAGDDWFTADSMRDYARQVVAPYAERIRLLTDELENWKKSNGLLAASRDRWKESTKQACRMQGGICSCHSGGAFGGCAIERGIVQRGFVGDGRTAGTAPEGWNLVPTKPTEEMHVAAVRAIIKATGNDDFPPAVWSAMLAAAPSPQENTNER